MKIIAIMSSKGGTGKTMTAHYMSRELAKRGYRVLAVGADWQDNFAEEAGIDPSQAEITVKNLLTEDANQPIGRLSVSKEGFFMIPANLDYDSADKMFENISHTTLKNALKRFYAHFDFCIIDTPPTPNALNDAIMAVADKIIVPVPRDVLLPVQRNLDMFAKQIKKVAETTGIVPVIDGLLITKDWCDEKDKQSKQLSKAFSNALAPLAAAMHTKVYNKKIGIGNLGACYKAFIDEFLDKECKKMSGAKKSTDAKKSLKRGESIVIHFKSESWPYGYASCIYSGRRNGKYNFRSDTYGWKYTVDLQANTVICSDYPDKIYQIDNSTGWAERLPQ